MMRGLLVGFIKGYRLLLSPWLGASCRFEPTCSVYAIGAIEQHGAAVGTYLAAARLARCHPWCKGGNDPVPLEKPRLFTHLGWRSSHIPTAGFDPASQKKSS